MGTKILVVDDNVDTRKVLHHSLVKEGYEVVVASSGAQGIELTKKEIPNLIVLDISMPSMDGWSVAEELKKDSATAKIPILMLTALKEPEAIRKSFGSGAIAYMSKPFDLEKLKQKIKYLLLVTQQGQETEAEK